MYDFSGKIQVKFIQVLDFDNWYTLRNLLIIVELLLVRNKAYDQLRNLFLPMQNFGFQMMRPTISCTPDRNCHTFCLGDKIASHPGVLTQAKKNTQNLEINQILGIVVQEKESNMVFCSRWKFPTLGMTVLSGTSVPLSTVIPWVGNFHLEQNPI